MIAKQESALLSLYARELLERAYESMATRYSFRPLPPIRVEFYRRHADFSVRTVGLTGIGALGVSFGNVLAMDSPTGRETGPFNWGTVLWHELGHTFTLGITDNKVPRWLSEGLSVFEERKSGIPGWGADVTAEFLRALKANMLVKVSNFNDGFTRPLYPELLLHSYYQASLFCEMVEAQFGDKALGNMLAGYKAGQTTEQIFRSVLSATPAQIDERFDGYLRTRFRSQLAVVGQAGVVDGRGDSVRVTQQPDSGEFARTMVAGVEALESGNTEEALRNFRRAVTLFPQYAQENSPYVLIARILAERNDLKGAADQLALHNAINENSYDTYVAEARFREQLGDFAGAARALDRSMYIYPYNIASHEKLAELAAKANDKKMVVRERRAVVALKPVDLAEAYYQLAFALHENGENAAARREVLRSLEEAPNFGKAQDLLLKIRGGAPDSMRH
jgi:tetratricopeptide (TPR) repeat protein